MDVIKLIKNDTMPDDVHICQRLCVLAQRYHPDAIQRYFEYNGLTYSTELQRHLNNLILTYSVNAVENNWRLIIAMSR